jgi:hypothetical protein
MSGRGKKTTGKAVATGKESATTYGIELVIINPGFTRLLFDTGMLNEITTLIDCNKINFKRLWVTDDLHGLFFKAINPSEGGAAVRKLRVKFIVIYLLFFDFGTISKKSNNIWYNEIREIVLDSLFDIDPSHFKDILNLCFPDETREEYINIKTKLSHLHISWLEILSDCGKKSIGEEDFKIITLERKGGQTFPFDYELMLEKKESNDSHPVKIEFKFSNTGNNSIQKLAEFAALSTESKNGLEMLGSSYLEFFYDKGYFQSMCDSVQKHATSNVFNFTKEEWLDTAGSIKAPTKVTIPTTSFHAFLRDKDVTKNAQKKVIVNDSFDNFTDIIIADMNSRKIQIQEFFNFKQGNKYFCIFTNGEFTQDAIPALTVSNITKYNYNSFTIECTNGYSIRGSMSWGNGGAGNQNPRILFKLIRNGDIVGEYINDDDEEGEEGDMSGGSGGLKEDVLNSYGWFLTEQELAEGDVEGQQELNVLEDITGLNDTSKRNINTTYTDFKQMILRSGRAVGAFNKKGGSKKSKKNLTKRKYKKRKYNNKKSKRRNK